MVDLIIGGGGGISEDNRGTFWTGDNRQGFEVDEETNPSAAEEFDIVNPDFAIHFYGPIAVAHTAAALVIWFVFWQNGSKLLVNGNRTLYWWTWLGALIAVCGSWGPVALFWPFIYTKVFGLQYLYFFWSLGSIDGPMGMYAAPLIMTLWCYLSRQDTGLYIGSVTHYWLGITFFVTLIMSSIMFQIIFVPSIRVWFNTVKEDRADAIRIAAEAANRSEFDAEAFDPDDFDGEFTVIEDDEEEDVFSFWTNFLTKAHRSPGTQRAIRYINNHFLVDF